MTSTELLQASMLERMHNKLRVRGQTEQDTDHLIGTRRRKFFPGNGLSKISNDTLRAKSEPRDVIPLEEATPEVTSEVKVSEPPFIFSKRSSLTRSKSAGPSLRKSSLRSEYKEAFKPWVISRTLPPSPPPSVRNESNLCNGTTKEPAVTPTTEINGSQTEETHTKVNGNPTVLANGVTKVDGGVIMSTSLPAENTSLFWSGDDHGNQKDYMNQKRHFTTATKGPGVLFQTKRVEVSNEDKINRKRKTEYKSSFKPFWKYVYIPSEGRFKKVKEVNDQSDHGSLACQGDWRELCRERHECALAFQKRSESGHPIIGETLEDVYRRSQYLPKDRSIAALALATTRLRIQDLKSEQPRNRNDKRVTRSVSGTRTRREVSSAKTGSSKATPNPPKTADKASKPKEDKVWMQPKASSQDQPKTEPSKPIGKPVTIPPTNNPTPAERKPKDSVAKPIAVKVTEIAPKTEEEPLLVFATCTPTNGVNGDCKQVVKPAMADSTKEVKKTVEKKEERRSSWFSKLKKKKSSKGDDVIISETEFVDKVKTTEKTTIMNGKKAIEANGK